MKKLILFVILFSSVEVFSLQKILEDNLDVVELCLIDHFSLEDEHPYITILKNKHSTRVNALTSKRNLQSVLEKEHMNDSFFSYILRDYLSRRNLSEPQLFLMYKVAELAELEALLGAYKSRLIGRRTLLRRSNSVHHFKGGRSNFKFTTYTRKFTWDGEDFSLTVSPQAADEVTNVETSRYYDELRHALHSLMQLGNVPKVKISLKQADDKNATSTIDPNFLFQQLYLMTTSLETEMSMLGDVDSKGNYKKSGYFRYSYDSISESSAFIVSKEAEDELLELVMIEGVQLLGDKIFLSAKNLSSAVKSLKGPKNFDTHVELFQRTFRSIKYKARWPTVIGVMDKILAENPYFLSAELVKKALSGKVKRQLSYASSYREFNYFFRVIDEGYASNSKDLSEVMSEISKIQKSIHPDFKSMLAQTYELAKDKRMLAGMPTPVATTSTRKGTTLSKGGNARLSLNKKIFKSLREVRYKRDRLLDQQKVIEKLFFK